MNNPCDRACPRRTALCHSQCEAYLTYYEEQKKRRAASMLQKETAIFYRASRDKVIHRLQRKSKPSGGGHKD